MDDFESFFSFEKRKLIEKVLWKLIYDEIIVVNKEIGMVSRSDMFLFCNFLIGVDFILESKFSCLGLVVRFWSVVKLFDGFYFRVKIWKNVL